MENLKRNTHKSSPLSHKRFAVLGLQLKQQFVKNAISSWLAICLTIILISCSDDEPDILVTTQSTTVSFGDLNTCDINDGGKFATLFEFTIPYQASSGIEVEKITTEWQWSTGNSGTNEETNFSNTGTSVVYDWCWRFGEDDWVDLTARIVTKQGVTSSPSTLRLNKPAGAN